MRWLRVFTHRIVYGYSTGISGVAGAALPMRVPRWERFTRPGYRITMQVRTLDDDAWCPVTILAEPIRNRWGKLMALRFDWSGAMSDDPDASFYIDDLGAYSF